MRVKPTGRQNKSGLHSMRRPLLVLLIAKEEASPPTRGGLIDYR